MSPSDFCSRTRAIRGQRSRAIPVSVNKEKLLLCKHKHMYIVKERERERVRARYREGTGAIDISIIVTLCSTPILVSEKSFLLCQPLLRDPAAETPILPLIWCFESRFSHMSSSPEDFFSQTPVVDTRQRGVQWMAGAVDGGHRCSSALSLCPPCLHNQCRSDSGNSN